MRPRSNDPDVRFTEDLVPVSDRFGDVYFSAEDGLAETRAVFLDGCGLPEAWAGRRRFTVAELGFGTGLNIAALLTLWAGTRPPGARLHVFTVEAYPMSRDQASAALGRWPEVAAAAAALTAGWPSAGRGFHRLDLPEFGAVVDVAVMEAVEALESWQGKADAWFLDGFSPASNPEMWRDEVLAGVRARSAPRARVATFTVAGEVRRRLSALGFTVGKRPGFGRKRERLEALLPGPVADAAAPGRVAIVGGGVAGASLARALRAESVEALLVEAEAPGAGASGNPAALVTPRFDAGGGPQAELFAQAFERAVALYEREAPDAVIARGALQLEAGERDAGRFDRIVGQPLWAEGALERLPGQGMAIRDGLTVEPAAALSAFLGDTPMIRAAVARIEAAPDGWRLIDADGRTIAVAGAVALAAGWGLAGLRPDLPLRPARGQASFVTSAERPAAAAWGGYVIPTRDGFLFGATFDRGDAGVERRAEDDARNLATLAERRPALAASVGKVEGRARVRATTPDHLPACGELEPGLWVLGGLGSRGFTTAPLLAEHLAARLAGEPSPLPARLAALLEPGRFETASA